MADQELKDLVASFAVSQAKTDAGFAKLQAAREKADKLRAKDDKKFASMLEMLNGITTSQGLVAEEFFITHWQNH